MSKNSETYSHQINQLLSGNEGVPEIPVRIVPEDGLPGLTSLDAYDRFANWCEGKGIPSGDIGSVAITAFNLSIRESYQNDPKHTD